eukprot:2381667-Prymnesium_polylepis.3
MQLPHRTRSLHTQALPNAQLGPELEIRKKLGSLILVELDPAELDAASRRIVDWLVIGHRQPIGQVHRCEHHESEQPYRGVVGHHADREPVACTVRHKQLLALLDASQRPQLQRPVALLLPSAAGQSQQVGRGGRVKHIGQLR